MDIQRVDDDSTIWKNRGIVSQELLELFKNIESFDPGATYQVQLAKAYKSLKKTIARQFADKKTIDIKPKDQTWTSWYIRVDPRQQKLRKQEKTGNKETSTSPTAPKQA